MDLAILVLPIIEVARLTLPKGQKLAIAALFLLGAMYDQSLVLWHVCVLLS